MSSPVEENPKQAAAEVPDDEKEENYKQAKVAAAASPAEVQDDDKEMNVDDDIAGLVLALVLAMCK